MSENNHVAENVTVEQVGKNTFQVFKDGRPVTGPLPPLEASKFASNLNSKRISKGFALKIVAVVAATTAIVSGFVTGDIGTGVWFGGVVFVMMSIGVLWRI